MLVTRSPEQTDDASRPVQISYRALPAVGEAWGAIIPGKPQLFENVPNNIWFDRHLGDKTAI
jgi:hypothetical protein